MPEPRPGKLGILAGSGALPQRVAQACEREGIPFLVVDLGGAADSWVQEHEPLHVSLGQVGKLLDFLKREGCDAVTMAGPLTRPQLSRLRFDWGAAKMLPRIAGLLRQGDDALLHGIATIFEEQGFQVIGPQMLVREVVAGTGPMTRAVPDAAALADIERARAILSALGPQDVGQAVVVADGLCLAVEAAEGTARMLDRVSELRAAAPRPAGVLVKLPKPGQDRRIDLPTVGPETARAVAEARLAGMAVEAAGAFVIDRAETVRLCDEAGLFLLGLEPVGA